MFENLSISERIDAALHLLDQMAESKGRERCAQICVAGDILDSVKKDVLAFAGSKHQAPEEPKIELVETPEEQSEDHQN